MVADNPNCPPPPLRKQDRALARSDVQPLVRLKTFLRGNLSGECKILSKGDACLCPLCDLDRISEALRWYGDEAERLSRYGAAENAGAIEACMTALMLDAGKRADDTLGPPSWRKEKRA